MSSLPADSPEGLGHTVGMSINPPDFEHELQRFDYSFAPEQVAKTPARPRDSARLQVIRRGSGTTAWSTFRKLADYLPSGSLLVLNDTRVIPARLIAERVTGGRVALLYLSHDRDGMLCMADRRLQPGEFLRVRGSHGCTVIAAEGRFWRLKPVFGTLSLMRALERYGQMPLPPYIKQSPLTEKQVKRDYQTVFARARGSVAAPTASLHFTDRLLRDLRHGGIQIARVTLHVHLGTFAPLTAEQWQQGILHREWYRVPPETVRRVEATRAAGRPVIAVGTTVMRTLESAALSGRLQSGEGETQLFIREGFPFRVVDGLITNYHVPKSSLLMLVGAFAGYDSMRQAYQQAVQQRCRLFSFGDGMLIL